MSETHDLEKGPARARHRTALRSAYAASVRLRRGTMALLRRKWVRRSLITTVAVTGIVAIAVMGLWLRLSSGPISIGFVTPWLADAIVENLSSKHLVTIGGTQIERDQRGRTSVRILDIVVRDPDGVVVASAPKAEIGLSGSNLLHGRLRAQSLNLVGAELSVRIETDGSVTIFAGANTRPIAQAQPSVLPTPAVEGTAGLLHTATAALAWIDAIGASGWDGQGLSLVGLKDGNLTVDDARNGKRWTFSEINVSLSRPEPGGVIVRIESETHEKPWLISAALRPLGGGVRAVGIEARQVSLNDILLASRMGGGVVESNIPLSASLRAELASDGKVQVARGQLVASRGYIQDRDDPDSRIDVDRADIRLAWDGSRQLLLLPFQVQSSGNQITVLARASPMAGQSDVWSFAIERGDPVIDPVIFAAHKPTGDEGFSLNRVNLRGRIDFARRRAELQGGDVGRTDTRPAFNIGVALTGNYDWSDADARLGFGVAATRMPLPVMRRLWPALIAPNVRNWVNERISGGTVERVLIAGNVSTAVLADPKAPLPDEALSIEIETSATALRPVAKLPPIRDADLSILVTGRSARVYLGRGTIDVASGRRLNIASGTFQVPDTHLKPTPASSQFRIDGAIGATAALLAMEPLKGAASAWLDPATTRGNVTAQAGVNFVLTQDDVANVRYRVTADLTNFVGDNVLLNHKLEAQTLQVTATDADLTVKGDARINGVAATTEFRKANADPQGDLRVSAVVDEAARRRLGINLGPAVTGNIPVKLTGRIGADDSKNKIAVDADFTPAKIDELLPGWVKAPGRPARITFNFVTAGKHTRFDDLTLDTQGGIARGSVELDANNDIVSANFPVFALTGGDQVSLRAERMNDGALNVIMRGEVYDGRQFVKSSLANTNPNARQKQIDFDLDIKLGAVAGHNGEALRGLDMKVSRRAGRIRNFSMKAKIGRDTPLLGEFRLRQRDNRQVLYFETDDAGALFRFTDIYPRMFGGQMWVAMDPPVRDATPQVGVLNIQNFTVRGEQGLDRVLSNAPASARQAVDFSEFRCDFSRVPGRMLIKEGVVRGPTIGATLDGHIDYAQDELRLRGTFVPLYGLNNMFGKIPLVGLFLGGGSNEGLVGINYEASGSPDAPRISINPISAVAPGLLRKLIPGPGSADPNYIAPTR